MKIEIFSPQPQTEHVLRLALKDSGAGEVSVVAVNEKGDMVRGGCLITFANDGTIRRHVGINASLGLKLDRYERVAVSGEY